jgi:Fe-S cluster assembly iron-binding protein IscA
MRPRSGKSPTQADKPTPLEFIYRISTFPLNMPIAPPFFILLHPCYSDKENDLKGSDTGMNIQVSELALAKMKWLIWQEQSTAPLAFRVISLTSGCGAPTFALEMTEPTPAFQTKRIDGVLFAWLPQDAKWMDGLVIDLNRENGKFSIYHPHPSFMSSCPFE